MTGMVPGVQRGVPPDLTGIMARMDATAAEFGLQLRFFKLSRVAEGPVRPPPRLGEHGDEVLRGLLELGDEEIAALRREGVIG